MKFPIYMDYHATTPVDRRALDEMLPYFTESFGNAASRTHAFGWTAEAAVGVARERIASLINASRPEEIIFTSGATESDNLAIKGVAEFYQEKGKHIITTRIEHKAILDSCKRLEKQGFEVTYLDVTKEGFVTPEALKAAIRPDTILCSVMLANNEVGTVQPIAQLGAICREHGVLFHTDAVQGIGRVDFDVEAMNVDLASITSHKMYGPKGVGALYVRRSKPRVRLTALMDGGGHERGYRSGTLNVPGIVGFGKAAELAKAEWREEAARVTALRDRLHSKLTTALDEVFVNGPWPAVAPDGTLLRLPNNLNISFAYVEGESILMSLKTLSVSSGSACTSASLEPSYVLRALGIEEELAHTSIRYGLGRFSTVEEVDYAAETTIASIRRLRDLSPLYEMAKEGIDLKSIAWTGH
ncbi:MAG: IscS subfamily cysteine desulfurase [Deltaproteobacteria bacterium]|nr:IscS subfamily cysteine desulfurase [Deltaproteobacteria bacterium]